MRYQHERGSALIIMVSIAAVVLLLMIVGQMSIYTKEIANTGVTTRAEYLNRAAVLLENWYRRYAVLLDDVSCPEVEENTIFEQSGVIPVFGLRAAIGNCIRSSSELSYRNVAIWIPSTSREDTSGFNASGIFIPSDSQVEYRLVSGIKVQGEMVNETRTMLMEMARLLEARFKSKIDGDPARDLRYNYFRALDCANPGPEEIPCTSVINNTGYATLENDVFEELKLAELASISHSMTRDSWGRTIEFNNVVNDYGNICVPSGQPDLPPYTMLLRAQTPWGSYIVVCPTQPIN